jgi:transposase
MIRPGVRVWLATSPVDMRRSFDRLAEYVRTTLCHDPLCNRSAERVKILWWDREGYALFYKRLERGTFQFPSTGEKSVAIESAQLKKLLSGLSVDIADNSSRHG